MHMRFLDRFKPKGNLPSILGYLLVGWKLVDLLVDALDLFSVAKVAWGFLPNVWQFLTSRWGTLAVIVVGVVLAAYGNVLYEKRPRRPARQLFDPEAEQLGQVLRRMMRDDESAPKKCVIVQPTTVDLGHVTELAGPYLTFEFRVQNASVYDFRFDEPPKGHVSYGDKELMQPIEFPPGHPRLQIRRTEGQSLELRQFLLPDMAREIMQIPPNTDFKRVEFHFGRVEIWMSTDRPDGVLGKKWLCPLPASVSFALREHEQRVSLR